MKVDLLNGKIRPTFFTLFASAIGSTIITTVYSTVDMMCIGHHSGPDATASIACVNPLWALMFAPGVLAGVGGSVMMSNRKASGNKDAANGYFTISFILAALCAFIVALPFLFFPEPILKIFGAEGRVLQYSLEYIKPVAFIAPTFTLSACLATFMRNDGEAFTPTVATAVGGVTNIILDLLLVFVFDLGVFGAGLATSIGQTVAFLILLSYFFTKKCDLKLTVPKNVGEKLYRISTLGASAFIIEISSGLTVTVYNRIIISDFSNEHLAVYGTASTFVIMLICLFNGIGTALQPLASFNYGACKPDRVRKALSISLKLTLFLGVIFLVVCQAIPGAILKMYMDVNDAVMAIGPEIFRIYTLCIIMTGVSITSTFFLQSILKRGYSLIISLARGLVFPLLFVFVLPLLFGKDAIWWSIPAAEAVTFILSLIFLLKGKKNLQYPIFSEDI